MTDFVRTTHLDLGRRSPSQFQSSLRRTGGDLLSAWFLQHLLNVSDRLTDTGELLPTNAFAVYRKP